MYQESIAFLNLVNILKLYGKIFYKMERRHTFGYPNYDLFRKSKGK